MATAVPAAYLSQPAMLGDEPHPQQPAAASGGKAARAGKRGRFGSRRRVEEAEQQQTSAEAAVTHPQNASERAAAVTQRTAAENVSLRSDGDMLNKRVGKLDNNVESLQVQLEAERAGNIQEVADSYGDVLRSLPGHRDSKDITPYMHEVACHFPRWMELHGNLDALSSQCMAEHRSMEIKEGFRKGSNHKP
eukprot:jgi/Tetstr1/448676/TSEL_035916.t1